VIRERIREEDVQKRGFIGIGLTTTIT